VAAVHATPGHRSPETKKLCRNFVVAAAGIETALLLGGWAAHHNLNYHFEALLQLHRASQSFTCECCLKQEECSKAEQRLLFKMGKGHVGMS